MTGTSNAWLEGAHSSAVDGKTGLGGAIAMLNLQRGFTVCKHALLPAVFSARVICVSDPVFWSLILTQAASAFLS